MNLSGNLKRLRKKRGFTLERLAFQSGISVSSVVQLESGRNSNPTLDTIERLAGSLGVKPEALVRS